MATTQQAEYAEHPGDKWHLIGAVEVLSKKPCRKIYQVGDGSYPLALFHVAPDKFFLTNSACPHERGPLEQVSFS